MSNRTPFQNADSYKLAHWCQYPEGTQRVYLNLTARYSRIGTTGVIFFGLQMFLNDLQETFQRDFFDLSEDEAVQGFSKFYRSFFGVDNPDSNEKVRSLHQLGRLPLMFKAVPEGMRIPYRCAMLTVENTLDDFFWLPGFIESWMSAEIWPCITAATMAAEYKKLFVRFAEETSDLSWFPAFQGHDFSMRGLPGRHAAGLIGPSHGTSFTGSDSLSAVEAIRDNYGWDFGKGPVLTSVPATEHSVMCAGGEENEIETIRRIITKCHPTGIVSIVSDSWDFWKTVTEYYPALKDEILARDGKVVIRPDSSPKTPVEIICGDPDARWGTPEHQGLIQLLWNTFGGTVNSKGYKQLCDKIGAIYGDSITLEYAEAILNGLQDKGFAASNIVFGIGSYTYQYVTRDTHSVAIKCTAVKINGAWKAIHKDPKTDTSGKKSARGFLSVFEECGAVAMQEWDVEGGKGHPNPPKDLMQPVWINGEFVATWTFQNVRDQVSKYTGGGW